MRRFRSMFVLFTAVIVPLVGLLLVSPLPVAAQVRSPAPEPPPGLAAFPEAAAAPATGARAAAAEAPAPPASGSARRAPEATEALRTQDPALPTLSFIRGSNAPEDVTMAVKVFLLMTILSLAPSIIMMMTSYTRIVIVLSFVKRALATQDLPPNQILFSLALFLTFFVMAPTLTEVKERAWDPYQAGAITMEEAYGAGIEPVRTFMLRHTRPRDLATFVELSGRARPRNRDDVPTWIVVPAFMLSEIHTSFVMGILIFLPFLVIDMVVSSVLMSMGMIMLPPVMISLPFKILLFVLVDGWNLVAESILRSYGG